LLSAAETVQRMLGVSPSAWADACQTMGQQQAAITLAGIYQRADRISSHGGYLRRLTDRARQGKFSVWPMITALLKVKQDGQTSADSAAPVNQDAERENGSGLEFSESLLKSLKVRGLR